MLDDCSIATAATNHPERMNERTNEGTNERKQKSNHFHFHVHFHLLSQPSKFFMSLHQFHCIHNKSVYELKLMHIPTSKLNRWPRWSNENEGKMCV